MDIMGGCSLIKRQKPPDNNNMTYYIIYPGTNACLNQN